MALSRGSVIWLPSLAFSGNSPLQPLLIRASVTSHTPRRWYEPQRKAETLKAKRLSGIGSPKSSCQNSAAYDMLWTPLHVAALE